MQKLQLDLDILLLQRQRKPDDICWNKILQIRRFQRQTGTFLSLDCQRCKSEHIFSTT